MPQGFFVASHSRHHSADEDDGLVEQMSLSDGLASVSVFIERIVAEARGQLGSDQMGALNVYSLVVSGHHVTVVGDVPAVTVKMIAEAVEMSER
jgi:sigma-E factor negative regulatory protein RseB